MQIFNYLLYGFLALMVAYLWLSYLRLVDVFQPDSWRRIFLSFFVGCFSVLPVFGIQYLSGDFFDREGSMTQSLLFYILEVGAVEEASKLLLAFVVLKFLVKAKEPIDYLVHGAAVAAGFAAVENMLYIESYGVDVIRGRAPISAFIHMALVSVPLYFYAENKYLNPDRGIRLLKAFGGYLLAVLIHGLFDFFLSGGSGTMILGFAIYFLMVEVWLTQINNLLNLSPHFNKKAVPDFRRVQRLLIIGFLGLMFGEIVTQLMTAPEQFSLWPYLLRLVFLTVLPVLLIMSKFSNLRLIPGKLFPIFFQFINAFRVGSFRPNRDNNPFTSPLTDLRIDSPDELEITRYLYSKVRLVERVDSHHPVSVAGILSDKYWVQEDEVFFGFEPLEETHFDGYRSDLWLIKAKTQGATLYDGYQEVMVFLVPEGVYVRRDSSVAEFTPRARCYIKPLTD